MSVTYQPKKHKRARTHGFLARKATAAGRKILALRRLTCRRKLSTV